MKKNIIKTSMSLILAFALILSTISFSSTYVQAKTAPNYFGYVNHMYLTVLDRDADLEGIVNWVASMKTGLTKEEVASGFFTSAEFNNRDLTNSQYVDVLYQSLLGRDAEPAGKAYWLDQLNWSASRETIFTSILNTPECVAYLSNTFGL